MKKRLFMVLTVLALMVCVLPMAVSAEECAHTNTGLSKVVVAPTCEEGGYTRQDTVCLDCGATISEGGAYLVTAALGHDMGHWVVTTAPGCETAGVETDTCANGCGKTETREVAATGHEYYTNTVTVAPTCEEKGYTRVDTYCENCDYFREGLPYNEKDALGHDTYGEVIIVSEPTCEAAGVKRADTFCRNCDYVREGIPYTYGEALGHDTYGKVIIVSEPTCEAAGIKRADTFCTRCDEFYRKGLEYSYGEAKGHNYVGTVTKEATYWDTGIITYVCQNDPTHTYEEVIPVVPYPSVEGLDSVPRTGNILIEWLYALIFG